MKEKSEIEILIQELSSICPDIIHSQLTSFGEKPFESGVWKIWLKDNERIYVIIEVLEGLLYIIYGSKNFENKYPIEALKIRNFLKGI